MISVSIKELPFSSTFFNYYTGDDHIAPSTVVRDLGLLINSSLNWDDHINKLCKCGKKLSGWILSVFYSRDSEILLTPFNSLVRSKMEYCSQIWDPSKFYQINALEQVQRHFTSKFKNLKNMNYWERLKELGIMSLQRRRERLTILFVWKIKYNRAPNVINLTFVKTMTKLTEKALVRPLPKVKGSLLSLHKNSFAIKAAKLWNILPIDIAMIDTFQIFQNKLDALLELYPDEPPVKGYYHINSNSLLDYKTVKNLTSLL